MEWLNTTYFGNSMLSWLIAVAVFLATMIVLPTIRGFVDRRRRRWNPDKVNEGIELAALVISRTSKLFVFSAALWAGQKFLVLPPALQRAFEVFIILSFWIQVGLWVMAAIRFWIDRRRHDGDLADVARRGSFEILLFVARLAVFSVAFMLALDNLGVEIKPLLAGLGIGGIAIALAVQSVLGDLLASLSIAFDKPFEIGDFLIVGDEKGTVERIGIKSTRLRSLSGEQLIISNSDLLTSRLRNYKRMQERRVVFTVGVTYETPADRLRAIPGIIEAAVKGQQQVRFERSHFVAFGDFSLNFETVYHVLDRDYLPYADAQQAINLAIFDAFVDEGIEFAYPTARQIVEAVLRKAEET